MSVKACGGAFVRLRKRVCGCGCVRARYLSLADNAIRLLPNSIGSLRFLADLNVSHNEVPFVYTGRPFVGEGPFFLHEETCAQHRTDAVA